MDRQNKMLSVQLVWMYSLPCAKVTLRTYVEAIDNLRDARLDPRRTCLIERLRHLPQVR